ncbi:MAG TPA: SAM-dependent methyltransferase [Polyangia bacterium]
MSNGKLGPGSAVSTTADGGAPLTGYVTAPGFEAALLAELGAGKLDGPRWPSLVTTRSKAKAADPAFALQVIPAATQVRGESVRDLVVAADEILADRLEAGDGPIVVHAYVPDAAAYRTVSGRAALLGSSYADHLRQHRRRVSRRLTTTADAFSEAIVVQLVLVGRTSLLVSASKPQPLATGGFDLAPWPGGVAAVDESRAAPSRAYRKLVESFAWLGAAPERGQTCVDLGGSPGGWAFTALTRGASVIAVDRSPLSPPAAGHPKLAMVIGNAFTYRPPGPVDWLLCDVICEPEKTIALVERWIDEGLCTAVIATLKFKGAGDYGRIGEARTRLAKRRWDSLRIKHMRHHNNEAVIMMRRQVSAPLQTKNAPGTALALPTPGAKKPESGDGD